jgi:hypothetical protein
MLSKNVFRRASEQHCFKIRVWCSTLIQSTRHLDSIVAQTLLIAILSTASTQSGHSVGMMGRINLIQWGAPATLKAGKL